jgi:hypothetical protein
MEFGAYRENSVLAKVCSKAYSVKDTSFHLAALKN